MSSSAYLYLGPYELLHYGHEIDPSAFTLFVESDRSVLITRRPLTTNIETEAYQYRAKAWQVRQRLELMGFTLERATRQYDAGVQQLAEEPEDDPDGYISYWSQPLSFEQWLISMRTIINNEIWSGNLKAHQHHTFPTPYYLDELTDWYTHEVEWLFPSQDDRYMIRAAIECIPDEAYVAVDFTELVSGGYVDSQATLCSDARKRLSQDSLSSDNIIVLTEGSTDITILSIAMELLYPHLRAYYTFPDFGSAGVNTGAGGLAGLVRGFIGAGIKNRAIALFDNDTAALDAINGLKKITIPDNVRIIVLPMHTLASSYPTLGPQVAQPVNMDINRRASSIELYLGQEALTDENGELVPVMWTSYIRPLKQYQGEIIDKSGVFSRWLSLVKQVRERPEEMALHDWSGLRLICDAIRGAFNESS